MWNDFLSSRPARARRDARPNLEGLEDRFLLYATTGSQWPYPVRITYSFIPDGTNVGGASSSLFKTMSSVGSTSTWEAQFEKAAAVWETIANVQLTLVPDDGAAIGTSGDEQGDSRFGDIRIGAISEQSGDLALTFFPPPSNSGTIAGDMFFNSNISWSINSGYDIESVALHEFGHALGMDHSQIQQAIMYASYTGVKQTPNSDDVAGIDSIYGAVPSDPANNAQMSSATNITGQINSSGQVALSGQEIYSATDDHFYEVTVPASTTGTMTVSIQSANLSSLAPRVVIYDSSGSGVVQASNTNGYGTTASVSVTNVTPGQVYYIKTLAANTGAGSIGTYGLLVNFGSKSQAAVAPPNTTVASTSSGATGTSSNETAGVNGGGSGALLGALLNDVFGLVGYVVNDVVHIGNLSGAGDALKVSPAYAHRHHLALGSPHRQPHTLAKHPKPPAPHAVRPALHLH